MTETSVVPSTPTGSGNQAQRLNRRDVLYVGCVLFASSCLSTSTPREAHSLEHAIEVAQISLLEIYNQQGQRAFSKDEASALVTKVYQELAQNLGPNLFPQQDRDFSQRDSRELLTKVLYQHNYYFRANVYEGNSNNYVYAHLCKLNPKFNPFEIQIGAITLPIPSGVDFREIDRFLVDQYSGRSNDRTVLLDTKVSGSRALLYSPTIDSEIRADKGDSAGILSYSNLLGLYARTCFEEYTKNIPGQTILSSDYLAQKFPYSELQNAFSDYVALRYGDEDPFTVMRKAAYCRNPESSLSLAILIKGCNEALIRVSPNFQQLALAEFRSPSTENDVTISLQSIGRSAGIQTIETVLSGDESKKYLQDALIKLYSAEIEKMLYSLETASGF